MITSLASSPLMQGVGMARHPERAEAVKSLDGNGDGTIDKEELSVLGDRYSSATGREFDLEAVMNQFDTDGDGVLSEDEGLAVLDKLQAMAGGSPPPRPDLQGAAGLVEQYRANADGTGYSSALLELLA